MAIDRIINVFNIFLTDDVMHSAFCLNIYHFLQFIEMTLELLSSKVSLLPINLWYYHDPAITWLVFDVSTSALPTNNTYCQNVDVQIVLSLRSGDMFDTSLIQSNGIKNDFFLYHCLGWQYFNGNTNPLGHSFVMVVSALKIGCNTLQL